MLAIAIAAATTQSQSQSQSQSLHADVRTRRTAIPQPWPACNVNYIVATQQNCAAYTTSHTAEACNHAPQNPHKVAQAIKNAAHEITLKIPQCTFTEKSSIAQNDLLVIAEPDTCYVNHVGYAANAPNIMSLGWCATNEPVIKHELLHILGAHHEHQNVNAQPHINTCQHQPQTQCYPNDHNCNTITTWVKQYDPQSIMHYQLNDIDACNIKTTKRGRKTLRKLATAETQVGNFNNITIHDENTIRTLYGLPLKHTQNHNNHNNHNTRAIANTAIAIATIIVAAAAITLAPN